MFKLYTVYIKNTGIYKGNQLKWLPTGGRGEVDGDKKESKTSQCVSFLCYSDLRTL